jgi:hypothetical protein
MGWGRKGRRTEGRGGQGNGKNGTFGGEVCVTAFGGGWTPLNEFEEI